ncbi:11283_t:CDS:2 [Scutellospora calospora]|uniref:11283_t:CDS:1 n=1 Tax=Scutellospora calospora TaxID=85575 RepID=A0ACA9K6U0_9GLOM|nr:11283_t:CDS:2 [Scutellospora calospora]
MSKKSEDTEDEALIFKPSNELSVNRAKEAEEQVQVSSPRL